MIERLLCESYQSSEWNKLIETRGKNSESCKFLKIIFNTKQRLIKTPINHQNVTMLRNCACFQRQRRGSSFEDSSSCRSSEIERGSEVSTNNGSILKLITSRGWCRQWRKTGSTISMSKIERSKYARIRPSVYLLLCVVAGIETKLLLTPVISWKLELIGCDSLFSVKRTCNHFVPAVVDQTKTYPATFYVFAVKQCRNTAVTFTYIYVNKKD